jgi:hypothetical protein
MTTTTRLSAGAGTVDITHRNATYAADAQGIFECPANVASELINLRVAVIAPDAAPVDPLAFNPVFNVSGGVTLNNDANGRLVALEIAHFASIHKSGEMPLTDSAGQRHLLTPEECLNLAAQFRDRLNAAA